MMWHGFTDLVIVAVRPGTISGAEAPNLLPEDFGEETGAAPEFVERVEAVRQKTGRILEEAEELVKREMPQAEPPVMPDAASPP